jgi:hypothetical protein
LETPQQLFETVENNKNKREIKENWSEQGQQRGVGGGGAGHFNVLKRPKATTG